MTHNTTSLLEHIEINPSHPPIASVIWLHGLGADGHDFEPIVPELNLPQHLPIRFIFPHAPMQPVTINNGYIMRAWYDIVSLDLNRHADQKGISESQQQLVRFIEHEKSRGILSNRIFLAGFSQGAVIALTTGLTYSDKLGGILGLSGYLPFSEQVIAAASQANKNTSVFLGHGTEDSIVPYFLGQSTHDTLIKNNYSVAWHSYRMPHSVCMEEIQDIGKWIVEKCEA